MTEEQKRLEEERRKRNERDEEDRKRRERDQNDWNNSILNPVSPISIAIDIATPGGMF